MFKKSKIEKIISWLKKYKIVIEILVLIATATMAIATFMLASETKVANQINYRPYVMIQAPLYHNIANNFIGINDDDKKHLLEYPENTRGFRSAKYLNTDVIFYSLKNVGITPAHLIGTEIMTKEFNEITGEEIEIVDQNINENLVLFQNQEIEKRVFLGKDKLYREVNQKTKLLVKIMLYYKNSSDLDKNIYYTLVEFKIDIQPDVYAALEMEIENEDEGIVKEKNNWLNN